MSKHRLTILNLMDPQKGPSTVPIVDDPAVGNVPLLEVGKRYAVSLRLVPLGQLVTVSMWKLYESTMQRQRAIKVLTDDPHEDRGHPKFGSGYIGEKGDDEVFAIKMNDDTGDPNAGRLIEFAYYNNDKDNVSVERESIVARVKAEG